MIHWIIYVASMTHLTWGFMLIFGSAGVEGINALLHLVNFVPGHDPRTLGFILVYVSIFALFALWKKDRSRYDVFFVAPQQLIMLIGAWSCIHSSLLGEYANGTKLPGTFIFADQCWHLFNCIGHTLALATLHAVKRPIVLVTETK